MYIPFFIKQGLKKQTNSELTMIKFKKDHHEYFKQKLSQKNEQIFYQNLMCVLNNHPNNSQQMDKRLFKYFGLKKVITKSHLCAKILFKDQKAFRCKECMYQDNSIICVECFQQGDHHGHNYQMTQVSGGCCDCGDDQKWSEQGFCKKHRQQNNQVSYDKSKTNIFIKQFHLCFQILFSIYEIQSQSINSQNRQLSISNQYGLALIQALKEFNKDSLVSNNMTAELFLSQVKRNNTSCITIMYYLFDLYLLSQLAEKIVELYIIMFTVKQFRIQLTQKFILKSNQYSNISSFHQSPYHSLSCQLYTSHQTINKLLQQGKIQPILFNPNNLPFQKLCNHIVSYFADVLYLSRLYRGVDLKYLKLHMHKRSIVDLSLYRLRAEQQPKTSMDYFGLQKIYIENASEIIRKLKNQKNTLKKMMKDLYKFCISHNPQRSKYTVYISQERTLGICLYAYFDGKIHQLSNSQRVEQLIQILGLYKNNWKEQIKSIMSKINFVIEFEAAVLSNYQDMNHYLSFYTYSFKRSKIVQSTHNILIIILNYLIKYLSNNTQSIGDYITIKTILNSFTIQLHQKQKQLRIKTVKLIISLISLYIEIASSNYSQIIISCPLQLKNQQKIIQLYSAILSNYQNLPLKDFKIIKTYYLEQQEIFQKFIKNNAIVANGRAKIKEQYKKNGLCSLYFESSKKIIQNIVGQEKISLSDKPICIQKKLMFDFFNRDILKLICQAMDQYSQSNVVQNNEQQKIIFNDFIFQIIKLNFLIKDKQSKIDNSLKIMCKKSQIWNLLNQKNKKYMISQRQEEIKSINYTQQDKKNVGMSNKNKIIQQMKNKLKNASKKWGQQSQNVKLYQNQNIEPEFCIICKESHKKQLFIILCLIQRSNLYNKLINKTNKGGLIFSSCYHKMHLSCYYKTYGSMPMVSCVLCKTVSNVFIPSFKDQNNNQNICLKSFERILILNGLFILNQQLQQQRRLLSQQQVQKLTIKEMIGGMIIQILGLGMNSPQYFIKKKLKIYHNIHKLIIHCIQQKNQLNQIFQNLLQANNKIKLMMQSQQQVQQTFYIQKLVQVTLLENIVAFCPYKSQIKDYSTPNYSNIGQQKIFNIKFLVNCIVSFSPQAQQQILKIFNKKIQNFLKSQKYELLELPKQLKNLGMQIGKCPNCNHITDRISLCLICKWKGCQGCQKMKLTQHTRQQHQSKSIFIKVGTGNLDYVFANKRWKTNSIYQNYMGQPYEKNQNKQKYFLNQVQYQKHINIILFEEIQQTVLYKIMDNSKQTFNQQLL